MHDSLKKGKKGEFAVFTIAFNHALTSDTVNGKNDFNEKCLHFCEVLLL